MEPEERMVSFDVISLFPSTPIDLAKDVVAQLLLGSPIDIPTENIMEMLNHCLNNFCIFDDEYYKQNIWVPMGSPISGFIAEAVMQTIEAKIMAQYWPRLRLKYVDDTFVIRNCNDLEHFHTIINSINANIKFATEEEQNNQLLFLDVLVQRHRDGQINTSVYRKSSTSDIVLHYRSYHPTSHNRSASKLCSIVHNFVAQTGQTWP